MIQPCGLQKELLKLSRESRHWVLSLSAEIDRLREENGKLRTHLTEIMGLPCGWQASDTTKRAVAIAEVALSEDATPIEWSKP
jgi:hypothetical protein